MVRQASKDYVLFPALSHRRWRRVLGANVVANGLRNAWAYIVIVCGHFADGAEKFTESVLEDETKPEWYLRQMLGTANFRAGRVLAFMSGNLCYQIEHHLFPDLPSNRLPEIAERVRALCVTYDLPYTTGSFIRQYLLTVRTICKLALPVGFMSATCRRRTGDGVREQISVCRQRSQRSVTGDDARRSGLATAIRRPPESTQGRLTSRPVESSMRAWARGHPGPVRSRTALRSPRRTWPRSAGV